jgi:hypothetical protein
MSAPADQEPEGEPDPGESLVQVQVHVQVHNYTYLQPAAAPAPWPAAVPAPPPGSPRHLHGAYAVWRLAGDATHAGVYVGGSRAWSRILTLIPSGRYVYIEGTRLRRAPDEASAIQLYCSESARHGAPDWRASLLRRC